MWRPPTPRLCEWEIQIHLLTSSKRWWGLSPVLCFPYCLVKVSAGFVNRLFHCCAPCLGGMGSGNAGCPGQRGDAGVNSLGEAFVKPQIACHLTRHRPAKETHSPGLVLGPWRGAPALESPQSLFREQPGEGGTGLAVGLFWKSLLCDFQGGTALFCASFASPPLQKRMPFSGLHSVFWHT